jgi:hypothetical protein
MDFFTLDYETYYDRDYSLSRMSTEDYVYDDRFEIIMVSLKKNDEKTVIFSSHVEQDYAEWLKKQGVHRGSALAHNMMFDGLILAKLGLYPRMYFDTLCMAQVLLKSQHRSISLHSCLKNTNSPFTKGTAVQNMLGRRLSSLTKSEFREYAEYCTTDTDGTHWLFHHLKS